MKLERQSRILQLISEKSIETQEELAELLLKSGFMVTQATVSRDIRDLKLTKITTESGKQKYIVLQEKENNLSEKMIRVFQEGLVSMDRAGTMIVLKTLNGMAMAVGAAIDAMGFDEIIGSIAGDDTIFCAVRAEENAIAVIERFNRILNKN